MKAANAILTVMALTVAGCGGGSGPPLPDPVPASGSVTLRGEPLANALVQFIPDQGTPGPGSMAYTDSSGKFELSTRMGSSLEPVKGAIPGRYKVRVSLMTTPDGKPIEPGSSTTPADAGAVEKLPRSYSDHSDTVLSAEVKAGGDPVVLKLM